MKLTTCLTLLLFATCARAQVNLQQRVVRDTAQVNLQRRVVRVVRVCTVEKPNESNSDAPEIASYLSRERTRLGTHIIGLELHPGSGKSIAKEARFRDCDYVAFTWSNLNPASLVPDHWADKPYSRPPYLDPNGPGGPVDPSQNYSDYFPQYVDPRGSTTPAGRESLPYTSYYELHRPGDKHVITRGRFYHHGSTGPDSIMADSIAHGLSD